jgi:CDP-diacylglycerol--glycerol-3-phosphate 3-phosphatidyltransferase
MSAYRRQIPNALSASRVVLAAAFLLIYGSTSVAAFAAGVALAIAAVGTDVLDGILARRWQVTSEFGYFWDGLGDKAFYFAILLVIVGEDAAQAPLAWVLIVRELVLYALRALDRNRAKNLLRLRPLSRYHALFIRLYFLFFFVADGARLWGYAGSPPLYLGYAFGLLAVVSGYMTLVLQGRSIVSEN